MLDLEKHDCDAVSMQCSYRLAGFSLLCTKVECNYNSPPCMGSMEEGNTSAHPFPTWQFCLHKSTREGMSTDYKQALNAMQTCQNHTINS